MVFANLRREERIGLGIALALHVALAVAFLAQPSRRDAIPPEQKMTVNLSADVGREATAPEPVPDPHPRHVLRRPIAVGTEWQASTVPYLLRRRQGFPPEVRHEHGDVPMRYAIESTEEAIEVPAGRFARCVRVRGQGTVRLFVDPVAGWRDVALVTTEWYCPGAGLVKLVREEMARSPMLVGGRLTLTLQ